MWKGGVEVNWYISPLSPPSFSPAGLEGVSLLRLTGNLDLGISEEGGYLLSFGWTRFTLFHFNKSPIGYDIQPWGNSTGYINKRWPNQQRRAYREGSAFDS